MKTNQKMTVKTIALGAIFTALVVVLQSFCVIRFGVFSVSLVLIPIVIGAAMCGKWVSAWLGFVFGTVVLLNGDAAAFLAVSVHGTIITVLLKGVLCGLCAGLVYELVSKKNTFAAVLCAAFVCPIVNTSVFLLGCFVFFMDTITAWANGTNVIVYMLISLVGGNFLFELAVNMLLGPAVVRLLEASKRIR